MQEEIKELKERLEEQERNINNISVHAEAGKLLAMKLQDEAQHGTRWNIKSKVMEAIDDYKRKTNGSKSSENGGLTPISNLNVLQQSEESQAKVGDSQLPEGKKAQAKPFI